MRRNDGRYAMPGGGLTGLVVLAMLTLAACAGQPLVSGLGGSIPLCQDVPRTEAAPGLYRAEPIYVSNEQPTDEVRAWAQDKPGFEEIWIDRDHNGWITLAFSRDAEARQAELVEQFPGVGVVAIKVDWTMAELQHLQDRVMTEGSPDVLGSGVLSMQGVVSIGLGYLRPEKVASMNVKFGGQRVCLEGIDPALAPAEGPQLEAGEGWRLLADLDRIGPPYRTGIAADGEMLASMWSEIGLPGNAPRVDFESEVAIWFGAVHGSSCPRLRLDGVGVDQEHSIVFAELTRFEEGGCTLDAIGHAYVVAVDRSRLPHGPFTLQLEAGERPAGVIAEELTLVDADLSIPGSTLAADQLHSPPPVDDRPRIESGGYVEPGYPWQYRLGVRCGIESLGKVNDLWWRAEVAPGAGTFVPVQWQPLVDPDGTIDLEIVLSVEPEPRIDATAGSHTVTYRPTTEQPRECS